MSYLSTTTPPHLIVIGGLVLNAKPLHGIFHLFMSIDFVDINQFDFFGAKQRVLALIQHRQYQVTLVAYSTGGLVALSIYSQLSRSIKLILINSSPFFMQAPNWAGISHNNYTRLLKKFYTLPLSDFIEHFICLTLFPSRSKKNMLLKSPYCCSNNILYWLNILLTSDFRQEFNNTNKKILALFSENDSILPATNNFTHPYLIKYVLSNSTHAALNIQELSLHIIRFLSC